MFEWLTFDNIDTVIDFYKELGFIIGFALTFLEAFLPFLPLFVIVMANAGAYGLGLGFVISWLGTVAGCFTVFLIVRKFGKNKRLSFLTNRKEVRKLIQWVDMNGFTPLLILLCFPFTPSIIVNIVAGLSNLNRKYYLFILLLAKPVMIFGMSYLGSDFAEIVTNPVKLVVMGVAFVVIWFVGKRIEVRLNKRVERDLKMHIEKLNKTNK